jgi:SAM-dependent methyltransferase
MEVAPMSDRKPSHSIEYERLYRERLAAGQAAWHPGDYDRFEMRPFIEEMLRQSALAPADGAILDLGCGTGQLACMLAALGFRVTAMDISPTAIAYGRSVAEGRGLEIDWRVADLSREELPERAYRVIVDDRLLHCIVSWPDRARLLRMIHGALLGGGELWSDSMVGRPVVDAGPDWRLDEEGIFWKACREGDPYSDAVARDGRPWIPIRRVQPSAEHLLEEFGAAGFRALWHQLVPPQDETQASMVRSRLGKHGTETKDMH